MKLIVAEKPSVGVSLARVVGAKDKKEGYYVGNDYCVTWCIGHLAGLATPQQYDEQYQKWELSHLPIIPEKIQTVPLVSTRKQFNLVVKLMRSREIDSVICATDSAREGELIFRRVFELSGVHKPVYRLWVSSSEDAAYKAALEVMKPDSEYDNLYRAGYARAVADWLVGINCTRGYTTLYGDLLRIGRVKTPLLGFIVRREKEIEVFQPTPYYRLKADFGGFYGYLKADTQEDAERIVAACEGKDAVVVEAVTSQVREKPPLLYNTTGIMKAANKTFGFTADETLSLLQSLYDKKLTTYPRVESEYLTSDMEEVALKRAVRLAERWLPEDVNYTPKVPTRLINDAKCEEHYALMPTETACSSPENALNSLSSSELCVFMMIVYRLFAALGTEHVYSKHKIVMMCSGYRFLCNGNHEEVAGFEEFNRLLRKRFTVKAPEEEDAGEERENKQMLPELAKDDVRTVVGVKAEQKQTQPPRRYTDSSLLTAMENAGRNITEVNLKNAISDCGLGTPATRAAEIKTLFSDGYAVREKGIIKPTSRGAKLVSIANPKLIDPILTAEWEQRLKQIAEGTYSMDTFLSAIQVFVSSQIRELQARGRSEGDSIRETFRSETRVMVGMCPRCGKFVYENAKGFCCEDRSCGFAVWKKNSFSENFKKPLTASLMKNLLFRKTVPVKGLTSKSGKKFDCNVRLKDDGKYVSLELVFDKDKEANKK